MVKEYSYEWKEPYAVNKLGRTILVLKTREDISAETIWKRFVKEGTEMLAPN